MLSPLSSSAEAVPLRNDGWGGQEKKTMVIVLMQSQCFTI